MPVADSTRLLLASYARSTMRGLARDLFDIGSSAGQHLGRGLHRGGEEPAEGFALRGSVRVGVER